LGTRVIGTSCCDVPAISEKVGDTRSLWCSLSSDGVFKKGTVLGPEWLPQAVVISLPYQAKLMKQCYYTYPWVEQYTDYSFSKVLLEENFFLRNLTKKKNSKFLFHRKISHFKADFVVAIPLLLHSIVNLGTRIINWKNEILTLILSSFSIFSLLSGKCYVYCPNKKGVNLIWHEIKKIVHNWKTFRTWNVV